MKNRDEKYVEALEDRVDELEKELRRVKGSRAPGAVRGSSILNQGSSAVAAEEMYRRARTEIAAEAGVGYGRVSLEALYLLPAEFTNVYQRLFLRALRESPGRTGEANPPVKTKGPKAKGKETRMAEVYEDDGQGGTVSVGRREVTLAGDRDPSRGGGAARAGGRRHRDHWTVADERAFRLKKVVDDQLKELAEWTTQALALREEVKIAPSPPEDPVSRMARRAAGQVRESSSGAAGGNGRLQLNQGTQATGENAGNPGALQCQGCHRFLKSTWNHCPHCGEQVRSTDGDLGH